ncbi:hypothetical protein ACKQTC_04065 [Peptococcus simiae]|uniref:Uncharacterized protein n=1 Tax=Peptococcus simiae TaxID=1643805 RepID=A0ABW9GZJ6_9FIRM
MDEKVGRNELEELTEEVLAEARASIQTSKDVSLPIAALSSLGGGVSSLVPAFHTVTETTTFTAPEGLYRIINARPGDVLKKDKDGDLLGFLKPPTGQSIQARFKEVDHLPIRTETVTAFNPATIMMAAALYSIEKDLSEIAATQKAILSFLELENESQAEADVESLMEMVNNYKYSWDNERSVASNHKLVLDIRNRARKNMIAYQKKVAEMLSSKQLLVGQGKMKLTLADLEKKFKYYRLSLYTFALASFMEIMLSENFKEEYICKVNEEIRALSDAYREQFERASLYLEKLGRAGVEANLIKGIGAAGKTVGNLVAGIPIVKKGPVDEFLQDSGTHLQMNAADIGMKAVNAFAKMANPGTRVIIEKMEDLTQIYNHTSQICCDKEKIYFLA